MILTVRQILIGFVLPAVLVAVGMALAWRAWWRELEVDGRWMLAPLGAAGFCLTYWEVEGSPGWPPGTGSVVHWIFYFAIAIGFLGILDAWLRPTLWLRAILLLILWQLAGRLLLGPLMPGEMSRGAAEVAIDAASLIGLGWWLAFEKLSERRGGVTVPLSLLLASLGSAVLVATDFHIQSSAQLLGEVAIFGGVLAALTLWRGRIALNRGGVAALALLVQVVLFHAYFYTDDALSPMQTASVALLAVSPVLPFAGDLPGARKLSPGRRLAVRIVPLAIITGLICGFCVRDFAHGEAEQTTEQSE